MIRIFLLIAAGLFLAVLVVCEPLWLSKNEFLDEFVTHEILALMAVVLTVTLASVANIHLALNRIILRRFKGRQDFMEATSSVKKEMNDNAWMIFWGFLVAIGLLVMKGAANGNDYVLAVSHAGSIFILLVYLASMYDIYKVVYGLVSLEADLGAVDGEGEDYSSENPEIGPTR